MILNYKIMQNIFLHHVKIGGGHNKTILLLYIPPKYYKIYSMGNFMG